MTAQHGILKPNPVLFDLEKRKKKPVLAHELGAGKTYVWLFKPLQMSILRQQLQLQAVSPGNPKVFNNYFKGMAQTANGHNKEDFYEYIVGCQGVTHQGVLYRSCDSRSP